MNYEIIDPSYMYVFQAAKILPLQYIDGVIWVAVELE